MINWTKDTHHDFQLGYLTPARLDDRKNKRTLQQQLVNWASEKRLIVLRVLPWTTANCSFVLDGSRACEQSLLYPPLHRRQIHFIYNAEPR
uniref:Uncharacterized protein n=1 Tax=Timema poppense TaxID=170557 RepID=A0A7R9DR63_TIMPO|nr:unnamed protein product [Timema poppensis]